MVTLGSGILGTDGQTLVDILLQIVASRSGIRDRHSVSTTNEGLQCLVRPLLTIHSYCCSQTDISSLISLYQILCGAVATAGILQANGEVVLLEGIGRRTDTAYKDAFLGVGPVVLLEQACIVGS